MKAHTMPACQVTGEKCWAAIWQQFHPAALATLLALLPVTGRADDDATATAAREAVAWAAPGQWQIYPKNPVLTVGPAGSWDAGALGSMTVLKAGGIYHMYYEAWGVRGNSNADYKSLQIGHATSKDGVNWTKDPANPVLKKGAAGEWDHDGTWDPFVLHEAGVFKMWYGGGMDSWCDWGYASSPDGVHFTKKGQLSHLGEVEDDHVVHDKATGKYWMYYRDRNYAPPKGVFRAVANNETDFDFKHAEPISMLGLPDNWMFKFTHVFNENDTYYMLFADEDRAKAKTRLATSKDGFTWTVRDNDLLVGHDGEVLKIADDLYFMYFGPDGFFDQKNCDIRLAVYKGTLKGN